MGNIKSIIRNNIRMSPFDSQLEYFFPSPLISNTIKQPKWNSLNDPRTPISFKRINFLDENKMSPDIDNVF